MSANSGMDGDCDDGDGKEAGSVPADDRIAGRVEIG